MHVLVTVWCVGDGVRLDLHYVHPELAELAVLPSDAQAVCHADWMRRIRPMLNLLSPLRDAQRQHEARVRAGAVQHTRVLSKWLHPVVLHDACTLYLGVSLTQFGGPGSWFRYRPCACGADAWGLSCTPPRWCGRRGRLVRDHLDELVAFCWTCLARAD